MLSIMNPENIVKEYGDPEAHCIPNRFFTLYRENVRKWIVEQYIPCIGNLYHYFKTKRDAVKFIEENLISAETP